MLDIHISLIIFVFVLFLILLVVLNRLLLKPLLNFMDSRDHSIAKDLKVAKGMNSNIDELNAKAEENISNAKSEAAAIRQKAIEEEKILALSKIETKQGELDKVYAEFMENLVEQRQNLKNKLLSQMPLFKESLKAKFSKL
ncbi:MAG: F0F1 ATP synthase subunit B' [Sulfurovum sp.]|nr:F0F1 ATP synthase subunit B' [Sulfurovum sp.]MCB4753316.1 F0F1 ATP synthase subunit B' [Sulfurovum sp.]MCB4763954.1 F0F1 ATP synthase subunit B' [Sulfurovum sp.]MCB4779153.1 F0F1 ATP synthase subunit B' [Sulfurovum sp.]